MKPMKTTRDFATPLAFADIGRAPMRLTLRASPAERSAIAERLGLPSIQDLTAQITIRRKSSKITVQGTFTGRCTQVCVVSLEPFDATEEGSIEEEFLVTGDRDSGPEIDLDPNAVTAEPLSGDKLDLGELVIQNLSLSLDPHPRATGAALSDLAFEEAQLGQPSSPFDQLRNLPLKQ